MPVLINNESQQGENLSPEQMQAALQSGSHNYALVNPEGGIVSAAPSEYHELLAQGHKAPTEQHLQDLLTYAKHSTPGQQALTFAEGAAKDLTFGASTGLERLAGVNPQEIRDREEVNPGLHTAGEVAGLASSALIPGGQLRTMGRAGEAVAAATGLAEHAAAPLIQKMGYQAAKQATEMAMLQGGDEVSKAFAGDPEQSLQTAMTDIGLSSLLGGGLGAGTSALVEPLWKATKGAKLTEFLTQLRDKAHGVSGVSEMNDLAQRANIPLSPELSASLSGEATAREMAETLRQSNSSKAKAFQGQLDQAQKDASDQALSALGRPTADLSDGLSEYEAGQQTKGHLERELRQTIDPISSQYEGIKSKFSITELPADSKQDIAERLGKLSLEEGHSLRTDSPEMKEIQKAVKDLPNLKTLEDLRRVQGSIRSDLTAKNMFRLSGQMSSIFRDVEEGALTNALGKEAPELLAAHAEARAGYKDAMGFIDDLNDRLHVGKYHGPESFLRALKDMSPEDVLRRLGGKADASLLGMLDQRLPLVAQSIREYQLDSLIKSAGEKDGQLNLRRLFSSIDKMSPESRQFVLPPEALDRLEAIRGVVEAMPKNINPSGTAKTLDKLWEHAPGGAGALVSMLLHGSGITGFILGTIGNHLRKEVPDAIKLALLKTLGSEGPIEAGAFKSMVTMAERAYKGAQKADKAVSSVFKVGASEVAMPSPSSISKLDKHVKAAMVDPGDQLDQHEDLAAALPDHMQAIGTLKASAVTYLNSLRPNTDPQAPLDPKRVPNAVEEAKYQRALMVAEQPLVVLGAIKQGSITPQDITTISTIYPKLYAQLQSKLGQQIIDLKTKGTTIPYKLQMGLGLFLGMPLESSTLPQNVHLNQPAPAQPPAAPQSKGLGQAKGNALSNLASSNATAGQSREQNKGQKV